MLSEWDARKERLHPRWPKGTPKGGQWMDKHDLLDLITPKTGDKIRTELPDNPGVAELKKLREVVRSDRAYRVKFFSYSALSAAAERHGSLKAALESDDDVFKDELITAALGIAMDKGVPADQMKQAIIDLADEAVKKTQEQVRLHYVDADHAKIGDEYYDSNGVLKKVKEGDAGILGYVPKDELSKLVKHDVAIKNGEPVVFKAGGKTYVTRRLTEEKDGMWAWAEEVGAGKKRLIRFSPYDDVNIVGSPPFIGSFSVKMMKNNRDEKGESLLEKMDRSKHEGASEAATRVANAMKEWMAQDLGMGTAWSGVVIANRERYAAGAKLWTCQISIDHRMGFRSNVEKHAHELTPSGFQFLTHEMAHGFSYTTWADDEPFQYAALAAWEEAVVELYARTSRYRAFKAMRDDPELRRALADLIELDDMGERRGGTINVLRTSLSRVDETNGYKDWVGALQTIAIGLDENPRDLTKELIKVPPSNREGLVRKKMKVKKDLDSADRAMIEAAIERLNGGTPRFQKQGEGALYVKEISGPNGEQVGETITVDGVDYIFEGMEHDGSSGWGRPLAGGRRKRFSLDQLAAASGDSEAARLNQRSAEPDPKVIPSEAPAQGRKLPESVKVLYHVSGARRRDSIQRDGLLVAPPNRNFPEQEAGVYLFDNPESAMQFAGASGGLSNHDPDIWAVEVDKLPKDVVDSLKPDPWFDENPLASKGWERKPGDFGAWVSDKDIPAEALGFKLGSPNPWFPHPDDQSKYDEKTDTYTPGPFGKALEAQRAGTVDTNEFSSEVMKAAHKDAAASKAIELLKDHGDVFVVGGAARDIALGRKQPKDIDLMARIDPAVMVPILEQHGKVDLTGKDFGVYRFRYNGDETEIALPRTEKSTGGGGNQDFEVQTDHTLPIEDDLLRRDFTVNAIAVNAATGEVHDPFGGVADAKAGILRTVSPQSFTDDALRMVRALSSMSRHGLKPDDQTLQQLRDNASRMDRVNAERIMMEMPKIFGGDNLGQALRTAYDVGILEQIFPEVSKTFGFDQKSQYHGLDLGEHIMRVTEGVAAQTPDWQVRLAALFHDIGKPDSQWIDENGFGRFYRSATGQGQDHELVGADMAEAIMNRLKFSNEQKARVKKLVALHMFPDFNTDKGARRFLANAGDEQTARDLLIIRQADRLAKGDNVPHPEEVDAMRRMLDQIIAANEATSLKDLKINGRDLIAAGVKPGPELGNILNELLQRVIDDPSLNDQDTLLRLAREMMPTVEPKRGPIVTPSGRNVEAAWQDLLDRRHRVYNYVAREESFYTLREKMDAAGLDTKTPPSLDRLDIIQQRLGGARDEPHKPYEPSRQYSTSDEAYAKSMEKWQRNMERWRKAQAEYDAWEKDVRVAVQNLNDAELAVISLDSEFGARGPIQETVQKEFERRVAARGGDERVATEIRSTAGKARAQWLKEQGELITNATGNVGFANPELLRQATSTDFEDSVGRFLMDHARAQGVEPEALAAQITSDLREILKPENMEMSIRVPDGVLLKILKQGKFKSQHESRSSGGYYNPDDRLAHEKNMFGDIVNGEFPIYGYPAAPDEKGYDPDVDLSQYGDIRVVIKNSLRERTTVTGADSLMFKGREMVPMPVDTADWRAAWRSPNGTYGPVTAEFKNAKNLSKSAGGGRDGGSYLELQFHGGVKVEDIEKVVLPFQNEQLIKALDKAGIPWEVRGEKLDFYTASAKQTLAAHARYNESDLLDVNPDTYAKIDEDLRARIKSMEDLNARGLLPDPPDVQSLSGTKIRALHAKAQLMRKFAKDAALREAWTVIDERLHQEAAGRTSWRESDAEGYTWLAKHNIHKAKGDKMRAALGEAFREIEDQLDADMGAVMEAFYKGEIG